MGTREAFDVIQRAIANDRRRQLVHADYRDDVFGNFHIAFTDDGSPRSIVNDRFELVVCDNLEGDNCRTVLHSMKDADEASILAALAL